jgi:SAM-dependent methyltransferase
MQTQLNPAAGPAANAATPSPETLVEQVRDRYAQIATGEVAGCGCSCGVAPEEELGLAIGYAPGDLAAIPEEANLGLGCGAPIPFLRLVPGETVLDLGSGGGIDAFLAARAMGRTGKVIGVDMTPQMVERATAAARRAGLGEVEFRLGRLERLPVESGTVDAVTSNCVINLVPDKSAVFREVARVLKPGGRLVISDILLDRDLPEALAADVYAYVGCVSGAERRERYFGRLEEAGLSEIEVLSDRDYFGALLEAAPEEVDRLLERTGVPREAVAGAVRSVIFRARKPAA